MKLRYGASTTRFTLDFDVVRRTDLDDFMSEFSKRLEVGWGEFSGSVVKFGEKHPKGVPIEYVMHPYGVKLQYRHHPWCTVRFEVSYDEIGDADEPEMIPVPKEIADVFAMLGFPSPAPIPEMSISHQISQKLHGLSEPGRQRVQDLVDLQLMAANELIDFHAVRRICVRLFANRKKQPWSANVVKSDGWESLYDTMRRDMVGIVPLDEAILRVNDLIAKIDRAR